MERLRVTYPLLVGILLGSSLPVLLLVQYMLDRGNGREALLEGRLKVRQEGEAALLHSTSFVAEGPSPLALTGAGLLLQDSFPWDPTDTQATITLQLSPAILGVVGEHDAGWSASYRERDTARADGLGIPPLPCDGRVVVTEARPRADHAPTTPQDLETLELAVDLRCTSAGPDLAWHTGDERVWSVEGPISLRR